MKGVNRVILLGNLGADPEISAGKNNQMIARLSVATSVHWVVDGQKRSHTEWHKCTAFKRLAEVCHTYLRKGAKVYIEGHLHTHKWQDNSGNDHYRTDIIIDELQMLDSKPANETPAHIDSFDDIPF